MAPSHSPVKYAGVSPAPVELNRVSLAPGTVLIVRGATQSAVYHTDHHCFKLRGVGRPVSQAYAEKYLNRTRCTACSNNQSLCGPTCTIGRHAVTKSTAHKIRLYELRQRSLKPWVPTEALAAYTEKVEA